MSDAKSPPDLSMDEILAKIRRIIAEDEQPGAPASEDGADAIAAPPAAEKPRPADDDVLELTQAIGADGSVRHLAPIGPSSRPVAAMPEPPPLRVEAAASEAPPERPRLRLAPEPAAAEARQVADVAPALPETAEAVSETPPAAADEPPREEAAGPPPVGARSLEDIVGDLLRPMLQTWLDANLPPLIERLVRAEVARVTRGAGSA